MNDNIVVCFYWLVDISDIYGNIFYQSIAYIDYLQSTGALTVKYKSFNNVLLINSILIKITNSI